MVGSLGAMCKTMASDFKPWVRQIYPEPGLAALLEEEGDGLLHDFSRVLQRVERIVLIDDKMRTIIAERESVILEQDQQRADFVKRASTFLVQNRSVSSELVSAAGSHSPASAAGPTSSAAASPSNPTLDDDDDDNNNGDDDGGDDESVLYA